MFSGLETGDKIRPRNTFHKAEINHQVTIVNYFLKTLALKFWHFRDKKAAFVHKKLFPDTHWTAFSFLRKRKREKTMSLWFVFCWFVFLLTQIDFIPWQSVCETRGVCESFIKCPLRISGFATVVWGYEDLGIILLPRWLSANLVALRVVHNSLVCWQLLHNEAP